MADAARAAPKSKTADEFLALPGEASDTKFELVDGDLVALAPASLAYGRSTANISLLLEKHLRSCGGPCNAVIEPAVRPGLRAMDTIRIADLSVSCTPAGPGEIERPDPMLLNEVLSPSNKSQTWEDVRAYASIPSLREILIVASTRIEDQVLTRDAEGHWPADALIVKGDETLSLLNLDLSFPARAIYAKTYLDEG